MYDWIPSENIRVSRINTYHTILRASYKTVLNNNKKQNDWLHVYHHMIMKTELLSLEYSHEMTLRKMGRSWPKRKHKIHNTDMKRDYLNTIPGSIYEFMKVNSSLKETCIIQTQ